MVEDKYIGLALAILSTMAIGTSFVITKKGLVEASERHGFEGDGFAYLKSPTWWGGIITMVVGEVANFAAYAFAPAILVTPLGALSVLIGAVLGAYFLKEQLGTLGKLGCAMCLIGSVIIVLHAPPDKEITTVDEILHYAIHPGKRLRTPVPIPLLNRVYRFSILLRCSCYLFKRDDLQGCSASRQKEPIDIYFYLLYCRINIGHVGQGIWHCPQADSRWNQPVHVSVHLCFHHRNRRLHPDPNELLQQGSQPVLDITVSTQSRKGSKIREAEIATS